MFKRNWQMAQNMCKVTHCRFSDCNSTEVLDIWCLRTVLLRLSFKAVCFFLIKGWPDSHMSRVQKEFSVLGVEICMNEAKWNHAYKHSYRAMLFVPSRNGLQILVPQLTGAIFFKPVPLLYMCVSICSNFLCQSWDCSNIFFIRHQFALLTTKKPILVQIQNSYWSPITLNN